MAFQVIGGTLVDVGDDVMGDVMGAHAIGASKKALKSKLRKARRALKQKNSALVAVKKAEWRNRQLAPGVQAPDEGMLTLPLRGENGGTFDLNNQNLLFTGRLQKPFRGERITTRVVRNGTSAVGMLLGQLFVGTDLQQVSIDRLDLESIGTVQGFGIRQTMSPAQPGVEITIDVTLSTPLTTDDTITATIQIIGRVEH